eukprot:jgi/Picre1/33104/NNA_008430.t1
MITIRTHQVKRIAHKESLLAPHGHVSQRRATRIFSSVKKGNGSMMNTTSDINLRRKEVLQAGMALLMWQTVGWDAEAAMPPGFKKDLTNKRRTRETVDPSLFKDGLNGLKYYDVIVGDGEEAREGSRVVVHFDAKYRGITFVTSRVGQGVAGGQPFGFDVGSKPGQGGTLRGLDLGVRGMRIGGQRKLIVPPELAYGSKGFGEIPPNAELVIDVQLLSIKTSAIGTQVKLVEG